MVTTISKVHPFSKRHKILVYHPDRTHLCLWISQRVQNAKRMEFGIKRDIVSNSSIGEKAVSSVASVGYQHLFVYLITWSHWRTLDPTSDAMHCQKFRNNKSKTNESLKKVVISQSLLYTHQKEICKPGALKPKHGFRLRGILLQSRLCSEKVIGYNTDAPWLWLDYILINPP